MGKANVKPITDKKRIQEVFNRGVVVQVLPSQEELFAYLVKGERLRVFIGVDPTSSALHLSHAKNYMFLEELRQLGHEVIVLIGDFTARIGDPSDRSAARVQLTAQEVAKNVKSWLAQIKPLMGFDDKKNPPRVLYNRAWLSKLSFEDVVNLASNFTVQQMMERDMFEKRLKENAPIHLHEFLYPLMQGYDSVAMDVNAELCGTDQIFNALAGRTLLKRLKNKNKFVIAVNLMENPKTGELMSKSRGTGVFLSSPPNEIFGALMAQPDEMTEVFFINCTRIPLSEKKAIMALGPRDAKVRVAFEIVKILRGESAAKKAAEQFEKTFSKKDFSGELQELKLPRWKITPLILLSMAGVGESNSEKWRLLTQGAVSIDGKVLKSPKGILVFKGGEVVKIGKRHFFRIKTPFLPN